MQEDYSPKLFKILKAQHSSWTDEEIDRKAKRLAELASFLVRLFLKQHSKRLESTLDQENED
ncbi:hypothetical protein A3G55_01295 [Candidatus Giovannonibacteria bacterium RIFCSPLOWO2_12_FULL_44_25]|uniref:Uncharacterized protein n=1 Tax=Candidatus Giovannonibacteria bacterium RIFCSPHIGHO2_02_FULL_45_40 TaxID=1798337 RepID=A0A1F5W913_9BACT|nr:MAG: hypothetical protein A2656_01745 [Candidatus Giovannonibacteria bacterium RIFCSPHIGHO2_01_FULL_44_100]OGF72133.1 MAG: hypothetical protein A3C05_02815 [Candidatus Giovannonibacteria bacterium RIFCSPHIGHO2_02_FULL_45_40]OGF84524.1 MAG: hypothetical protein A3A19_00130 [Candidatus Giovannonibacteria bacterium RIFCSPLOWO2_01_FULL_45_140]OGF88232.1 MAG: hypothetical protein A3I36_00980 [Candidatus Giovannonibacteria bacterium RIFCSPLOWO2_02_FULL_45_28]OGF94293.1 MAG: hypothetical protein A3